MIPQDSPEWVRARIGYATASRANDMFDYLKPKKGETVARESAARRKYKMEIVAERMEDRAVDHFVTDAMRFGLENEAGAKIEYEAHTGTLLLPSGFIVHSGIEWLGATPDSLIGSDALAEFKVPTPPTYAEILAGGVIPPEYVNQMLVQLAVTRRRYCDWVVFNPRVVRGPRLFIRRFEPDDEDIANCEAGCKQFLQETEELFMAVTTGEAA